jgi:hypothetical protein
MSGIGIVGATAIAATVADPKVFRSGRDFAAWIGIVPREDSTGGKQKLGPISKQVCDAFWWSEPRNSRSSTSTTACWAFLPRPRRRPRADRPIGDLARDHRDGTNAFGENRPGAPGIPTVSFSLLMMLRN